MIWSSIDKFGSKLIHFLIGIVIARILMPSDYGVVGLLAVFIAISETILDSGFSNALIQKQNRTDADFSTAFFFNIGVGSVLYAVIWLSAPAIARFYDLPILCDVARVYTLTIVINSLTIVQTAKLSIDLDFRSQSVVSLVAVLLSGLAGLFCAMRGHGVWALVVQGLAYSGIRMVLIWYFVRWMPKRVFSLGSFRQLFSFGSKLLCSSLINTIYNNVYALVIGKAFSTSDLGYFNRGQQFADLPTTTLTTVVVSVNYPLMSRLQNDDDALRHAYRKFLRIPLSMLYPLLVMMIVLAEPMILFLLGEKWLDCVPMMQVLCFAAMWYPLTIINLNLLYVKGRTDLVLKLEFLKKPVGFVILFATLPFGLLWLCAGRALYSFVAFVFNCYYTKKYIGLGFFRQMSFIMPIVANCAIMAGLMLLALLIPMPVVAQLAVGVAVGLGAYVAFAVITHDESLADIRQIVTERLASAKTKRTDREQ